MDDLKNRIPSIFSSLNDPDLLTAIEKDAQIMEVPAGTVVMEIGASIKALPLVMKGALKVLREDEDGSEIFLYFLFPGQSCAVTFQSCMAQSPSQIRAIAEDATELLLIPSSVMDEWNGIYPAWKNFILQTYNDRFSELMQTLDSVVFNNLDERLLDYLQKKASVFDGNEIQSTHQRIAYDLHSSREVISRLMKELEKKGKIRLSRNKIELL
jgi:CRP/FNR family transcriptional regulator, anaerobic regulatory protein